MVKGPNQSSSTTSSCQLQEKLQQLKNFYEKGQQPTQEKSFKKEPHRSINSQQPAKHLSGKNQKETIVKDDRQPSNETENLQPEAKRKRFLQMKLALDWLIDTYPLCFNKNEPKPLKRRIEKDVFAELPEELPFSRLSIREAIAYYTRSPKYRQALIDNSHRYDLQGEEIEEILPKHQQLAQDQLIKFSERQKARAGTKKQLSKNQQIRSKKIPD